MLKALKMATYPARRRIARTICRSLASPDHARLSFSADGEDIVATSWIRAAGIGPNEVRYLDIGAADPHRLSNTYLMALSGGSGVLIEPDPDQAKILRSARPKDLVLNVGIAFDDRRRARLWRLTSRVFNTFSREQAERIVEVSKADPSWRQQIVDSIEIELVPANVIIDEYFERGPHFISIDAEGVDFDILQSINFSTHQPVVICIERCATPDQYQRLLGPHGYRPVCETPHNIIFQR
jgi:FkbM family methyltransferase